MVTFWEGDLIRKLAAFVLIRGHQVLALERSGYKDNRKQISTQFQSQLLLGSCPYCFQASPVPSLSGPPFQFLADAELVKIHREQNR